MDLIANGGANPQVYANVNLTVQREQQCVAYDYPELSSNITGQLSTISGQGLAFYAISQLNGEDCGIFVAPLARGRWIHLWVDLEADNHESILRSEIHKNGQVIRSTDIQRWLSREDVPVSVLPNPSWGCTQDPGAGQLAHLGLNQVHKRSIELQDALYALRSLNRAFAVLEILGLTGDVAIMVQEPELPALWKLPAVSFSYSLAVVPGDQEAPGEDPSLTKGTYAADLRHGHVRMTADDANSRISLAFEYDVLAVRIEEGDSGASVCLTMPIDPANGKPGMLGATPISAAGIFDGVEAVGDEECNRFTFLGTGTHTESVNLWFSKEQDTVCRISMRPPAGESTDSGQYFWAVINVKAWEPTYHPADIFSESDVSEGQVPQDWNCQPAFGPNGTQSWLSWATQSPPDELPTASVLSKLAEAAGVVGLLAPHASMWLSRLVALSPSKFMTTTTTTTPVPPRVDMFGPELKSFSFSFSSTFPLQGRGASSQASSMGGAAPASLMGTLPRSRGSGEVHVDLAQRRLFLRSVATNISVGIPSLETRILFRGDRGRLYAHTKIGDDFEQCWSVSTAELFPAPPADAPANPFLRARADADGFSVPGRAGLPAKKYVLYIDQAKRAQLFVGDDNELIAINLDDLERDASTGVLVSGWGTAPIDEELFEPGDDWHCSEPQFDEENRELDEWELLRVFFPRTYNLLQQEVPRRELSV